MATVTCVYATSDPPAAASTAAALSVKPVRAAAEPATAVRKDRTTHTGRIPTTQTTRGGG